jgi:hypothetical protein
VNEEENIIRFYSFMVFFVFKNENGDLMLWIKKVKYEQNIKTMRVFQFKARSLSYFSDGPSHGFEWKGMTAFVVQIYDFFYSRLKSTKQTYGWCTKVVLSNFVSNDRAVFRSRSVFWKKKPRGLSVPVIFLKNDRTVMTARSLKNHLKKTASHCPTLYKG